MNSFEPLLNRGRTKVKESKTAASWILGSSETEDNDSICPAMTLRDRLIGFSVCMVIGYIFSAQSTVKFVKLLAGNPVPFVLNFTVGNIIVMSSSCFLIGPSNQIKTMFHQKRAAVASVYICSMVLSLSILILAVIKRGKSDYHRTPIILSISLLVTFVIQCLSSTWYSLSYIPFAREGAKKLFSNVVKQDYEQIV